MTSLAPSSVQGAMATVHQTTIDKSLRVYVKEWVLRNNFGGVSVLDKGRVVIWGFVVIVNIRHEKKSEPLLRGSL